MDKFEDCKYCKHRNTEECDTCDMGENFEDAEEDGLRLEYTREGEIAA